MKKDYEHILSSIDRVLSLVEDDQNAEKFFYNIGTLVATFHIHRIEEQRNAIKEIKKLIKDRVIGIECLLDKELK
jgi:hypothetical protein